MSRRTPNKKKAIPSQGNASFKLHLDSEIKKSDDLIKEAARQLKKDNQRWGHKLALWPQIEWGPSNPIPGLLEVWRSKKFIVQVHQDGIWTRLSIERTERTGYDLADVIPWDDLQRLKYECGRGDICAVELYPPDKMVVRDHHIRHLFLLAVPPPFCWGLGK